ncbi:hypothetical protein ACFV1W_31290 [Kitasatospora sp. NPDC059648]|uniref:hypothetical protein n=1 Tax=Kitasatospora sp. NPDC059648 TaxID=3346894 RepID=UPI0036C398D4
MTTTDETLRSWPPSRPRGWVTRPESLAATAPGERSLPEAIAAYADTAMRELLAASYGIHDGMPADTLAAAAQRMHADVGARMTKIWTQTLAVWAVGPTDLRTIDGICHALITITADGTADDVLPLLVQLRAAALADGL